MSVAIKHLSLTLLNSVKGVTIQRWHDWHPLGGRKTLWFAWLDAPIPVEGWACGWVAASELVKIIGWFHLECWELNFIESWWLFQGKMLLRKLLVGLGTWVQCWGRPSMAEIGFIGKVQTWSWEFGRFKSTTSPKFNQWNDEKDEMRSGKKRNTQ